MSAYSSVSPVYNPPMDPLSVIYQDADILVLDKPSGYCLCRGAILHCRIVWQHGYRSSFLKL